MTELTMVAAKLAAKRCSVSDPTFAVNLKTMRDFILNMPEAAKTCQHEWETLHDGAVGCRKCYADKAVWEATHEAQPAPETDAAKDERIAVLEKTLRIIKAENDRAKREFTNVSNKVIELAIAAALADTGKDAA